MSWQAYVDSSLVGTGEIDKGAIFSADGTSVWAATPGFTVDPKEVQEIIKSYADTGDVKRIQSEGLYVGGERYVVLKADDRSVHAKSGRTGVLFVKTKQTILLAHYPESVQPGRASVVVEKLADYMIGQGY